MSIETSGVVMRPGSRSVVYIGLAVAAISLASLAAEPREAEAQRTDPPQAPLLSQTAEATEIVDSVETVGADAEPACTGAVWPYLDPACIEGAGDSRPVSRVLRADSDYQAQRANELRRLAGGR